MRSALWNQLQARQGSLRQPLCGKSSSGENASWQTFVLFALALQRLYRALGTHVEHAINTVWPADAAKPLKSL